MASPCAAFFNHVSHVLDYRTPRRCAVTHALMGLNMTHETEKPDVISQPTPELKGRENIFLNWVVMIVAFGAMILAAVYLPALL